MNNIFNFLDDCKLEEEHFSENVEFYIPNFLPKKLITMIYADGGSGKSFFALSLAKKLISSNQNTKLIYLDFDNPLAVLKSRGVDEFDCRKSSNQIYPKKLFKYAIF